MQLVYDYDCDLVRAVDGDTLVLRLDLSAFWRANYVDDIATGGPEMLLPVDLGFGVSASGYLPIRHKAIVRLLKINAPELHGDSSREGEEATAFVNRWFRRYSHTRATTHKTPSGWTKSGKYGRYLAELSGRDNVGNRSNLGQSLVSAGLAVWM